MDPAVLHLAFVLDALPEDIRERAVRALDSCLSEAEKRLLEELQKREKMREVVEFAERMFG